MKFKVFTAALGLITLSSFACEPISSTLPISPTLKKIKIANRQALKRRLYYFGGIGLYFGDNEDFINALAEKETTRDLVFCIVTEQVDKDIAKHRKSRQIEIAPGIVIVTNNSAKIARACWIDHLTRVACDEYEHDETDNDTNHLQSMYDY